MTFKLFGTFYLLLIFLPLLLNAQTFKDSTTANLYGTVFIDADIPEAEVYIEDEFKGITPLTLDNLKFNFQYTFTIKKNGYRTIKKSISTYKSNPERKIFAVIGYSKLLVNSNSQNATLTIDNETIKIPTDTLTIIPGEHLVNINEDGYYRYKQMHNFESETFCSINVNLVPKSKKRAIIFSTLFPGIGQYYSDQEYKGLTFSGSEILSLFLFFSHNNKIRSLKSDLNDTYSRYSKTTNASFAKSYHQKLKKIEKDIDSNIVIRDISLASAISIWIINLVDIYFWHQPKLEMENMSINFKNDTRHGQQSPSIQITYKF